MIKKCFFSLLCLLLVSFSFPAKKKITIYMAGDSTMQTYKESETPMRGWGQYLAEFFTDDVTVKNKAIGGRSTRTFISENRWQRIMDELQKDDWVFIQFGHNDNSSKPERHTTPEDYRNNLRKFVDEVRAKDANPVLLTSITMRKFDKQGVVQTAIGKYTDITREVAREMNVPMIDLNRKTGDYVQSLGAEEAKKLYMWLEPGEHPKYPEGLKDNTHMKEEGAKKVAELAVEGIKELKLKPLVSYLKK
ncbi:rhamnogalacturonan acetylesterase [Pontibacter silvestris]|uniref:Rhamnogalacturonan acetylesterase n=1 Tax=Pontibacter silvestris TaxID=2305183 RepID=A0ABW4WZY8_9BACT|nr:rhamnogalacturonan acetylesterase [Pontibacter silvestris]MCC9135579.1 rhamnogalacturonan acetylesterase [Pontibacter silvestris]